MERGGPRAQLPRRFVVVRDEAEGDARRTEIADARLALLPEALVADRQHLVDDEDVGLHVLGNGEAEPRLHAGAVVLYRQVDEGGQLGEGDDAAERSRLSRAGT